MPLLSLLALTLRTFAVDVRLYENSANCMGTNFLSCNNQPAG